MDSNSVLFIAVAALVLLGGLFVYATTRTRDRATAIGGLSRETRKKDRSREQLYEALDEEPATAHRVEKEAALARVGGTEVVRPERAAPPAPRAPLDPDAYGVTRRQFFNRGIVATFALGLSAFGTTTIAFLWPSLSGGFGSKIRVGQVSEILARIAEAKEPVYVSEGRMYIAPYPQGAVDQARQAYSPSVVEGMQAGVVALYQKCPHLGCRVPWCKTSQWFECPCHGSQYNRVGEKRDGPAPRGMDRFPATVSGGVITVDTGTVLQGPPIGTNTTGQEAEGPHCA